jgi:hypothetical protein
MGRLTLNVLLSFAQFEREVTGERIRDKIAASKRKGMWMGGTVPMGYDLEDRHLVINPEEAKRVKEIYEAYLAEGCVSNLQIYLERKGIRSKKRLSKTGNVSGDNAFSRGALYTMLQNRVYLGEITHKGTSYLGQHPGIIDQSLWDRIQLQLRDNIQGERRRPRATSKSLLMGLLYDEAGNLFTPSHATKKGRRYRYYVSPSLIKGRAKDSTGPVRLPAEEIEELVLSQLSALLHSPPRLLELFKDHSLGMAETQQIAKTSREYLISQEKVRGDLRSIVTRIIAEEKKIELLLSRRALAKAFLPAQDTEQSAAADTPLDDTVVLQADAQLKRCGGEIRLLLSDTDLMRPRPVTSLVRAVARANDWMDRILRGEISNQRNLARETGFDERYISRIIPLAFLAPDITEAILEGRQLPELTLEKCVIDVSLEWVRQRAVIGPEVETSDSLCIA